MQELGEANAAIFEIHMMMVEDEDYNEAITDLIRSQRVSAEYAVSVTADSFAQMFSETDDEYMQARAADVRDISDRIINCLMGSEDTAMHLSEKVIICADDLSPSETAALNRDMVLGFVTAQGSTNSHTAILAREMSIPAVVGVGEKLLAAVRDGDIAIVDGFSGELIISPDDESIAAAAEKQQAEAGKRALLNDLHGRESITLDGTKIKICANIGSVAV